MDRVKLGEIAELTVGFVGTMAQHYADDGVPFLRSLNIKPFEIETSDLKYVSEDFASKIAKSTLHSGDLVIVRTGNPGTCSYVPEMLDGANCSDLVIVRPDTCIVNPRYLEAFINTWGDSQISNAKVGAIQKHFNVSSAQDFIVMLPERSVQDKVAKLITDLNAMIANNKKLMAELEEAARLIYDYWFTQFDFPNKNRKPYRSSGGIMTWCDELKREIPEGWLSGKLCDVATITMGQSPSGDSYNEIGDGKVFYQGRVDFGNYYPTARVYTNAPTRYAMTDDILLSVRAPVGDMNLAYEDCCIGRGLAALRGTIPSPFYVLFLLRGFAPVFDRMNGNGTTFGAIDKEGLNGLPIIVPSHQAIVDYENTVGGMYSQLRGLESETRELIALRDWLLPMLMNGQLIIE